MQKNTTKLLAILLLFASMTLFFGCQEQQPVESKVDNSISLGKDLVSTFTLPEGATIVSANLNLFYWTPYNQVVEIHNITAPWSEDTTTWNNFAGAYDPAVITTFLPDQLGIHWKSIDITSTVQGWADCEPNNGILLKNETVEAGLKQWLSKENTDPGYGIDYAPYLSIELSTGETVDLLVKGDTYIRSDEGDSNFGSADRLYCGFITNSSYPEKQTLLQFDVQCTPTGCETAYAYDENGICFMDLGFGNWGWTIPITEGTYNFPVYAGAGQCDLSKGTYVGTVHVVYSGGTVEFTYNFGTGFSSDEVHFYAGVGQTPLNNKGNPTVAPGSYSVGTGLSGPIYIIAHAVVCGPYLGD